jgi:hypothetical protein
MRNAVCIFILLLLTGCSLQQLNTNKLANQLRNQDAITTLEKLQAITPDKTDVAQYYLNLGYLQLITGQFDPAITSFSHAKKEMLSLEAVSITESSAASTVNETFRRYSGYPTDRVMVHNMLALSYLFNQDVESARVEMLQADISMKKLLKNKSLSGQLASTHLLSAIIYELLDERSNAFISYQLAERILTERKMNIPNGVKFALLRMSYQMGNDSEHDNYRKKYPQFADITKANKQIFNLYFDGVVSSKREDSLTVPSRGASQLIRISMPSYPLTNYRVRPVLLTDNEQKSRSEVVENIELLAREDLANDYPSILLSTTSRAVVKYATVKAVDKKDPLLGALFNMVTVLSEVADLRSWNMLPSTVQFNYLETNSKVVSLSTNDEAIDRNIDITKGKQHVILTSSLSEQVFHYQQ